MLRGCLGSYRGGGRNHVDFVAELTLAATGGDAGILLTFSAIAAPGPGEVGYTFAWGHPGDPFGPHSSARLVAAP
ncbi:hypothetical protein Rhe02_18680 [Rhizocola hellebori]|uniref:Uncharacterized protein n=1 Tax=Rhizocola hellebori TaxID=1392758 RepID=A0A8J3Q5Q0_9ACTN|nr:hypothetical protein [Rhizocola hellebori]GIH03801.1 hypothetical protein Rhe02_18680 [Rhizocola hellebori]